MTSMYFPLILIFFSFIYVFPSQLKIIPNVLYKRELVFEKKVKSGDHKYCHTKLKILVIIRYSVSGSAFSNLIVRVFICHNQFWVNRYIWKSINFSIMARCKLWKNATTSMEYGVGPSTVLETLLHLYF